MHEKRAYIMLQAQHTFTSHISFHVASVHVAKKEPAESESKEHKGDDEKEKLHNQFMLCHLNNKDVRLRLERMRASRRAEFKKTCCNFLDPSYTHPEKS